MGMDRSALLDALGRIGGELKHPACICLFGGGLGVVCGQPGRSASVLDVWGPASEFSDWQLKAACETAGIAFGPDGGPSPESLRLRVMGPGTVCLPEAFDPEKVYRFGKLNVVMPPPALIAASKLVRNELRDMDDVVWWQKERAVTFGEILAAIASLPNEADRRQAESNLVLAELVCDLRGQH